MRPDANLIALKLARQLFDAAHDFFVDVRGKTVSCTCTRLAGESSWPTAVIDDLDPASVGSWPASVRVDCKWPDGETPLFLRLHLATDKNSRGHLALKVQSRTNRLLLWRDLKKVIADRADGEPADASGYTGIAKRKTAAADGKAFNQEAGKRFRQYLEEAKWPLVKSNEFLLFRFTVGPEPQVEDLRQAFERVVASALLKMELLSGPVATGQPLIGEAAALHDRYFSSTSAVGIDDDDEADEADDEAPPNNTRDAPPLNLIYFGPPGTGKTHRLWSDFIGGSEGPRSHDLVTFHQSYGYEDFIEGIRPRVDDSATLSYELREGAFYKAARTALRRVGIDEPLEDFCALSPAVRRERLRGAKDDPAKTHTVLIDEINRGNVSRIFGELITLLEGDKRLGEAHELIVTLPASGRRFGVPPNLRVVGTMNTADRSVEALDAALRRRFAFEELAPRPELLDGWVIEGVDLRALLTAINLRLETLRDRDHRIGHAYFLAIPGGPGATLEALKDVFAKSVIPLLQEYFFGDWGKLGLVLGRAFVRRVEKDLGGVFADFDHDDGDALSQRPTYVLTPMETITNVDFQRAYRTVP